MVCAAYEMMRKVWMCAPFDAVSWLFSVKFMQSLYFHNLQFSCFFNLNNSNEKRKLQFEIFGSWLMFDQRKRAWYIMVWTAATRYYYNY